MNFQHEAKEICHMIGSEDEVLIAYVANKLEIAFVRGQTATLKEFDKMGLPMEKLDE